MSSQLLGTFIGIEYIEKITNGMINISTADPFEYIKNITVTSYNLEKQNIVPILNNILENKPKDAKLKIEVTGNSLKSYISFFINDYSKSSLELNEKKINLIRFDWSVPKNGQYITSQGRGREGELYRISWSYVNEVTNMPIIIGKEEKKMIKLNKVLSDQDLMDKIRDKRKKGDKKRRRNRRNIMFLLKVVSAILLFIIIMKFLQ
jgi:hypothetical protein